MLLRVLSSVFGRRKPGAPGMAPDLERLHERGKGLHRGGDPAAAIAAYRQALELAPGCGEVRFHAAVALNDLGRTEEALRDCIEAISSCRHAPPHWMDSGRRLADSVGRSGTELRDEPSARKRENDAAGLIRLGNENRQAGKVPESEAAYRAALSLDKGTAFAAHRLAALLAATGRHDEADRLFRKAAGNGIQFDATIALAAADLERLYRQRADVLSAITPASGNVLPPGDRAALFLGGDPLYLRRFAGPLLASIARNAGTAFDLQILIVDPDECIEDDLKHNLRAFDGNLALWRIDSPYRDSPSAKTYYACARFLHVHRLMRLTGRPVLVADLDLIQLGRPDRDGMAAADAAWIRWHPIRWDPWDAESASLVWFSASPKALALAEFIACYLQRAIQSAGAPWFLDQTALFAARALGDQRPHLWSIAMLEPNTLGFADGEQAVRDGNAFWSATSSVPGNFSRLATAPFLDYVAATKKVFGWTVPGHDIFFEEALARVPPAPKRRYWEHELLQGSMRHVRARRRAVDVGAHAGFWSAQLCALFERVEAFEPQPMLCECIRQNVTGDNLHLHELALGRAPGRAALETIALNSGMARLRIGATQEGVAVRALDEFDFDDVDLLKIDVEGMELQVLEGARATLQRCRPAVLIESGSLCENYHAAKGDAAAFLMGVGARRVGSLADDNHLFTWPV